MHLQDRWRIILDHLTPEKVTSVEDLTAITDASPATIRRDLNQLQSLGQLTRVRGGAASINSLTRHKQSGPSASTLDGQSYFYESVTLFANEKQRIAAKAVEYIDSGSSIIVGAGSTAFKMASLIEDQPIQVLTNSIPVLQSLLKKEKIKVTLSGGELFREQSCIINSFSDGIIENFYASRYFVGAQAISKNGLMQTDGLLVQHERKLINRAEEVIVLVDSSKFLAQGSLSVCPLSKINTIITDKGIEADARKMILDAGINLVIV